MDIFKSIGYEMIRWPIYFLFKLDAKVLLIKLSSAFINKHKLLPTEKYKSFKRFQDWAEAPSTWIWQFSYCDGKTNKYQWYHAEVVIPNHAWFQDHHLTKALLWILRLFWGCRMTQYHQLNAHNSPPAST